MVWFALCVLGGTCTSQDFLLFSQDDLVFAVIRPPLDRSIFLSAHVSMTNVKFVNTVAQYNLTKCFHQLVVTEREADILLGFLFAEINSPALENRHSEETDDPGIAKCFLASIIKTSISNYSIFFFQPNGAGRLFQ